jgi:hypothetical protein
MFEEINKILNLPTDNSIYSEVIINVDRSVLFLKIDSDNSVVSSGIDRRIELKKSEIAEIDSFYTPKASDVGTYYETLNDNLVVEVSSGTLTIMFLDATKRVSINRRYSKEQWGKILILAI